MIVLGASIPCAMKNTYSINRERDVKEVTSGVGVLMATKAPAVT
jgi:hypothetical protein